MIKVIASDMDGTLLGSDHKIAPRTLAAVRRACDEGIRFIIATGRNFRGAMQELEDVDLTCDYLVGSGAEMRDSKRQIVSRKKMSMDLCEEIYRALSAYPISVIFCTDQEDYQIGTPEEIEESRLLNLKLFFLDMSTEEIKKTDMYQRMKRDTRIVRDFQELLDLEIPIYKLFLFSENKEMLNDINRELSKNSRIAVASSFPTNLEITDVEAQKGPVLKSYIESLGYTMDEVMVFGDSMNDYSMLSMDFGATVAMENADPEIKKVAKYMTKSNEEFGVAYAIEELLKRQSKESQSKEGQSKEAQQ